MRHNQKTYHHEEFMSRYQIFKKNYDTVERNNAENNGMTLELNQFADLESKEFSKIYLGLKMPANYDTTPVHASIDAENVNLPVSLDWNKKGAVTPIKNQGQCGSCWSFSTTGSTEGKFILAFFYDLEVCSAVN